MNFLLECVEVSSLDLNDRLLVLGELQELAEPMSHLRQSGDPVMRAALLALAGEYLGNSRALDRNIARTVREVLP